MKRLSTSFLFCQLSVFLLAVLVFAFCHSDMPKAGFEGIAPNEMAALFLAADTLSVDALAAEAQKLSGTWADTFFQKRFFDLYKKQDGPNLQIAVESYKKIRPKDEAVSAFITMGQGIAYQFANKYDSAEIKYAQAQDWFEQHGDKKNLLTVLDSRSGLYTMQGKYDAAVAMKYRALELHEKKADKMYTQVAIANTFIQKGDSVNPFESLAEPIQFFEEVKDTSSLAYALTIQGNVFARKNDYAKCLDFNQKALALRRKIGATVSELENLHNVARCLGKLDKWQAALDTLRIAEKLFSEVGNKQGALFFQHATGEALFNVNRLAEADLVLAQNLETCRDLRQFNLAAAAALLLSKSKKKQDRPSEGLEFLEQHLAIKDSIFTQEKEKIIRATTIKYETREKEAQIAALTLEKKLSTQRNLLAASFILSLIGAGIGFLIYRHRGEKALLEKHLETQRLENDVLLANEKLNQQKLENTAREIDLYQTQLQDLTTLMLEKNTTIESLQSEIEQSTLASEDKASYYSTKEEANLEALYTQTLVTESDWLLFIKYFDRVFPLFLINLKLKLPELSVGETRLLMMHKMNLRPKEMADLLGISAESVRKLKYRFKKKTQVAVEDVVKDLG